MNTPTTLPVLAGLLIAPAALAADVVNGGFENATAFSGWTTSGTCALSTAAPAAPTEGTKCCLLTSRNTAGATLAALLGTTPAALVAAAQTSTSLENGGGACQTVTVNNGDTLVFDWKFKSGEAPNDQLWPDTCFVIINGEPTKLATCASMPSGWMPAFATFTKNSLTAGTYKIGFAVFNFGDPAADSQLAVDNVRIIPAASTCSVADVGKQGGLPGFDNLLDNNDFVAFIELFFASDARADMGVQGGTGGHDGLYDNNDFVVFIDMYFDGCQA